MNWTGGRLKHHSTANANPLLKSQKQYFAKARQRLQNSHASEAPSHYSIFDNRVDTHPGHQHAKTSPPHSLRLRRSSHALTTTNYPVHQAVDVIEANAAPNTQQVSTTSPASHPRLKRKTPPPLVEVNPLDRIKRRLLRSTDWAGLAIVKPVSINFTPAEEMERIGRRRQVTKEERRRKTQQAGQQRIHHGLIRPFRNPQSQSSALPAEPTDLSIRIGSNIHQTQTTQASFHRKQTSSATKSTATESMLLDGFEKDKTSRSVEISDESSLDALSPQKASPPEPLQLVPLQEARELANFDAVFERSSSVIRQRLPSTTPFGPSRSSYQVMVTANPTHSKNTRHNFQAQPSGHEPKPSQRSDKILTLAQLQEAASKQQIGGDAVAERGGQHLTHGRLSSPSRLRKRLTAGSQEQPPRFTLDCQVALERKMHDRGAELAQQHPQDHIGEHSKGSSRQLGPSPQKDYDDNYLAGEAQGTWQSSPPRVVDPAKPRTRSDAPVSMMKKYQIAKKQHQASLQGSPNLIETTRPQSCRLGDENDAWMRYVFPKDFGRIQQDFNFDMPPPHKPRSRPSTTDSWSFQAPRSTSGVSSMVQAHRASSTSAPTAANVTIVDPQRRRQSQILSGSAESETDFLSRLSPMEGVMNEALQNRSTYNNAAKTVRSFISMPPFRQTVINRREHHLQQPPRHTPPAKRTAMYAFEGDSQPGMSMRDTTSDVPEALQYLLKVPWKQHERARGERQVTPFCNTDTEEALIQSVEQHKSYPIKQRHRKGGFPLSFLPASSQKSKYSPIWNAGPPNVDTSPEVRVHAYEGVQTPRRPSTRGSQSLWQVSSASSNNSISGNCGRQMDPPSYDPGGLLGSSTPSLSHVRRSTPRTSPFF